MFEGTGKPTIHGHKSWRGQIGWRFEKVEPIEGSRLGKLD